jgi:hypothetical protein
MGPKIVYVASLPHSGSTFADMLLGGHPKAVSLGEVDNTIIDRNATRKCFCGKSKSECVIWSPVEEFIRNNQGADTEAIYRELIRVVSRSYGDDCFLVDSSCNVRKLEIYRKVAPEGLYALHVIKDMRNYALSQVIKNKILGRFNRRSIYMFNVLSWYRTNRHIKAYLQTNGHRYFKVGYEELALRTELMLRKICEFLGIEYHPAMADLSRRERTHIWTGNAWVFDRERNSNISYDYRWFHSGHVIRNSALLLPFFEWNRQNVYSNHRIETSAFRLRTQEHG